MGAVLRDCSFWDGGNGATSVCRSPSSRSHPHEHPEDGIQEIGGTQHTAFLPKCQPVLHLMQEASVEFVDRINIGEKQGHQSCRHGILLDHCTAEPLWEEFGMTGGMAFAGDQETMPLRVCDHRTPSQDPPDTVCEKGSR